MLKISAALLFLLLSSGALSAQDYSQRIRIATLNVGKFTNEYSDSANNISMKDTGNLYGAYLQWIENKKFQINLFGYKAPDVNYSRVYGIHFNADGYFLENSLGYFVGGIDYEQIDISMDAGSNISGLENFGMENDVIFLMARTGFKFTGKLNSNLSASVFPYAGFTHERVNGELTINPAGPPMFTPEMKIDISDNDNCISWGTNLSIRAFHFTELTCKYLMRMRDEKKLYSTTLQLNVFLPYHIAATYQYKYMKLTNGFDRYHLIGLGCVF